MKIPCIVLDTKKFDEQTIELTLHPLVDDCRPFIYPVFESTQIYKVGDIFLLDFAEFVDFFLTLNEMWEEEIMQESMQEELR